MATFDCTECADSTLASDALFFMVVSLVTDSLPWDFSFTLEEEFSLDFYLSGEENLVELVYDSSLASLLTKGETTKGAFWDYIWWDVYFACFYFSRAKAAASLGMREMGC